MISMMLGKPAQRVYPRTLWLLGCVAALGGCKPGTPQQPPPREHKDCAHDPASVAAVAAPGATDFLVSCNVTLNGDERITKRIIFEGDAGSGVTFDCNGAAIDIRTEAVRNDSDMIEIRSVSRTDEAGNVTWERPRDITLRNCKIFGAVRIYGMGKNSNWASVRDLSRTDGYVQKVRTIAPTRITLENLRIEGFGRTPLYLSTGVSDVTLVGSTITGVAESAGVYLDSESYRNTFRNNRFSVTSRDWVGLRKREEIAIDGSSYNRFINNHFSTLEGGGIFLYRNCGEDETIRHSEPAFNQVINNVFYYDAYSGPNPSVYFGAREKALYCGKDAGFPWGSSVDDRNYARNNVVYQNQIYKRSVADMIITKTSDVNGWDPTSRPNHVGLNETVEAAVERRAGCFSGNGYKHFVLDGGSLDVIRTPSGPMCGGSKYTCSDGDFSSADSTGCTLVRAPFECTGTTNEGCEDQARCPAGKVIVGAVAACNLEAGSISEESLAAVPPGTIQAIRPSDNLSDGRCFVGSTSISTDSASLDEAILDQTTAPFGCSERDTSNPGECHIRGMLWCR
jgi:Right handed beta helix region